MDGLSKLAWFLILGAGLVIGVAGASYMFLPRHSGPIGQVTCIRLRSQPGKGGDAEAGYSVSVQPDGLVTLQGNQRGEVGNFVAQLSPAAFSNLVSSLQSDGFWDLQSQESKGSWDGGTVSITVLTDQGQKEVFNESLSESLAACKRDIDSAVAKAGNWRKLFEPAARERAGSDNHGPTAGKAKR